MRARVWSAADWVPAGQPTCPYTNSPSANPLRVRLLICPDSDRQMDLDNRCKVALDSLMNGNLFVDDSQIETLELRRGPTLKPAVLFAWVEEFVPTRQDNLAWIKGP